MSKANNNDDEAVNLDEVNGEKKSLSQSNNSHDGFDSTKSWFLSNGNSYVENPTQNEIDEGEIATVVDTEGSAVKSDVVSMDSTTSWFLLNVNSYWPEKTSSVASNSLSNEKSAVTSGNEDGMSLSVRNEHFNELFDTAPVANWVKDGLHWTLESRVLSVFLRTMVEGAFFHIL